MLTEPIPAVDHPDGRSIHRFATTAVVPVAVVVGVAHLLASLRPGWWFDEATTLALGRDHLSFGYADQPPLAPLLAWLADALVPDSFLLLRLPAVLATTTAVLVAAGIARELGGDRRAQTLTALAQATTAWGSLTGHWATPYALEPVQWLVLGWLLVRWVRTRDDRLLLGLGVVTGVAAETRFQVLLLGAVLLAAALVLGPRALLRRPLLWVGVVIATMIAAPTLVWQAFHGWPQLQMGAVAAQEADALFGGRPGIAVGLVGLSGLMGSVLVLYGAWRLLADPALRFVGVTFVVLVVFFVVAAGRPYYLAGLWGLLAAAGAVGLQARREGGATRWRWLAWPAVVLSAALAGSAVWVSGSVVGREAGESIARVTAASYVALPPAERARTAVFAGSYVQAAFLDTYGRSMGLPPVYSTDRSYRYLPPPPESTDQVLYLGSSAPEELRPYVADMRPLASAGPDAQVWLLWLTPRERLSVLGHG